MATFRVDDVHAAVRALRERGVAFLGPGDVPFELADDRVMVNQEGLTVA